jgi:molybdopterin synthase catalytic subunit
MNLLKKVHHYGGNMNIVLETELIPGEWFEKLRRSNAGSLIFHYAVVKDQSGDKPSSGIRFERGGDMEAEMSAIEADIRLRWPVEDVLLVRRLGELRVGDLISLVAVSAAASGHAFEACQYGLSLLKKMTRIKKTELFLD